MGDTFTYIYLLTLSYCTVSSFKRYSVVHENGGPKASLLAITVSAIGRCFISRLHSIFYDVRMIDEINHLHITFPDCIYYAGFQRLLKSDDRWVLFESMKKIRSNKKL